MICTCRRVVRTKIVRFACWGGHGTALCNVTYRITPEVRGLGGYLMSPACVEIVDVEIDGFRWKSRDGLMIEWRIDDLNELGLRPFGKLMDAVSKALGLGKTA